MSIFVAFLSQFVIDINIMAISKKDKIYFSMLSVGVVLIVVGLVSKSDNNSDTTIMENKDLPGQINSVGNEIMANVLEGVLRNSDDLSRGNFKLVSQYSDIYIRTARDFSMLIGLEVLVKINGGLDKFELLDIQPRVAKDGYILQQ
ncbi:MAG: hypothetical protein A3B86_03035 [Candidatus Yanofskybacteria bacterium RIFCSPHIGHO2_02_FULL_38_22b]|uniref:Uncharacterized protein n=1 Tax=Candidatus Yanofskybacteria bacterium RIFCSPHIGHO2_02_FULL_38_22b TaxID=1802673 RepID=A0A1F8F135_9BACT|nr:MAG: hypothetical protein A2816_02630 [Candidatus Yanofskybacteria bacterium RIFCSPHIGHO2_01_FULL_39_44]OGN06847.1 MAG: hypothetical protein A3B86_03035 [Candidatus Yanofskybacteria bacterium RIFCSPHIGHO2_02_FULL_38_22b]OGN20742.1 MAG: hypothetical protein A2910_00995 [Candidatus Yanofskybacteria bacterium RIFCSPLOWO2_01_FULL_39_28]